MKKKIGALLLLLPTITMGCQVVLINDAYESVWIKDLNAPEKSFRFVKKGEKVNANFDPNKHARLLISMGPLFYTVQQYACSKSHTIPLTTKDIEWGKGGGNFLKITKGVALGGEQKKVRKWYDPKGQL